MSDAQHVLLQCLKGCRMTTICCDHPTEIYRMNGDRWSELYISLAMQGEGPWHVMGMHHKSAKQDRATGGQSDLDLEREMLKWMKEHQCSYTEEQLSFWTLLHPLMDGGETSSWHLVLLNCCWCGIGHQWHWIHWPAHQHPHNWTLDAGSERTAMWVNIRSGLRPMHALLQCLVETSVGCSWTTEGQAMTPEVSKLVDTFLTAMGMHMCLHVIRECWPMLPDEIPQQNLNGVCMWSSYST